MGFVVFAGFALLVSIFVGSFMVFVLSKYKSALELKDISLRQEGNFSWLKMFSLKNRFNRWYLFTKRTFQGYGSISKLQRISRGNFVKSQHCLAHPNWFDLDVC